MKRSLYALARVDVRAALVEFFTTIKKNKKMVTIYWGFHLNMIFGLVLSFETNFARIILVLV